eukprot:103328-Pelagomonas_calceolata.AAC.1
MAIPRMGIRRDTSSTLCPNLLKRVERSLFKSTLGASKHCHYNEYSIKPVGLQGGVTGCAELDTRRRRVRGMAENLPDPH